MGLFEVILIGFLLLVIIALGLYVLIIGGLGWQFFKYNFPGTKRRGAHYLILERSGRFKWIYGKFKSIWKWPDGTKSYIGKRFDRTTTAEPMIFLVEGYPTNAMLSGRLPPEEMSRLVNTIIKEVEATSRLEMELGDTKAMFMDKIVPVMTLLFSGIGVLVGVAVILNLSDIQTQVEGAVRVINDLAPQIQEALKNLPKQL